MPHKIPSFSKTVIKVVWKSALIRISKDKKKWNFSDFFQLSYAKQNCEWGTRSLGWNLEKLSSVPQSAADFLWSWQGISIIIQTLLTIICIKNISLHSYLPSACFTGQKKKTLLLESFELRMCHIALSFKPWKSVSQPSTELHITKRLKKKKKKNFYH